MDTMKEQHRADPRDAAVEQMMKAYERLHIAWETIRRRCFVNGKIQVDAAAVTELDAAEDAWLAARASTSNGQ